MPLYMALAIITPLAARMTKKNTPAGSRSAHLNRMVLFVIFAILFSVAALRGAVGNDYRWYVEIMHEVSVHGMVVTEPGFNAIVYILYALFGFENYRFIFALLSFLTVWLFMLWLWRESEDFAFSLALFMLSGVYFQSFSTVRYYAAMPLVLLSFRYCMKRDLPRFLVMVIVASLMHKSALVVLLLYPIACLRWKRWFVVLGIAFSAAASLFPSFWIKIALMLYPSYQKVTDLPDGSSPLNVVRCLLVLLLAVYVMRYELHKDLVFTRKTEVKSVSAVRTKAQELQESGDDETIAAYIKMTFMAFFMYVCAWFLPQLSRLAFYLILPQFVLLPALVRRVKTDRRRKQISILVIAFFVMIFLRYMMRASDEGIRVLPYTSFLFE